MPPVNPPWTPALRAAVVALGLTLLATMAACGPQVRRPTPQRQPEPTYTLVRRGAWLFEQPNLSAPAMRDPVFADRPYVVGRAVTMLVVRQLGEWVAVRPVISRRRRNDEARVAPPCVATPSGLRHLDIVLWVHRRDLVPAVRRETTYRYRDGTWIRLRAGVPVKQRKTALKSRKTRLFAIRAGRFRFNSFLPNGSTRLFWRRSSAFDNAPSQERLDAKAELRFGITAHVIDTYRWSTLYVQQRRSAQTGELVRVAGRCATLQVWVAPKHVRAVHSGGLGMIGGLRGGGPVDQPNQLVIPAGVSLTWRDGRAAGSTTATILSHREVASSDELRRCFRWSLRTSWPRRAVQRTEADLILCAPTARIVSGS